MNKIKYIQTETGVSESMDCWQWWIFSRNEPDYSWSVLNGLKGLKFNEFFLVWITYYEKIIKFSYFDFPFHINWKSKINWTLKALLPNQFSSDFFFQSNFYNNISEIERHIFFLWKIDFRSRCYFSSIFRTQCNTFPEVTKLYL